MKNQILATLAFIVCLLAIILPFEGRAKAAIMFPALVLAAFYGNRAFEK